MNLTDMIKQPTEGNRPKTDFMNMRKFEKGDRLSESVVGAGAGNTRGIDNLIQGLVDLLPKRDGIWPLQERAKWLRLAAGIFDLGYKAGDGKHSEITIMVVKQEVASRPRIASPAMSRDQARSISWLPRISLGLTVAQFSARSALGEAVAVGQRSWETRLGRRG